MRFLLLLPSQGNCEHSLCKEACQSVKFPVQKLVRTPGQRQVRDRNHHEELLFSAAQTMLLMTFTSLFYRHLKLLLTYKNSES